MARIRCQATPADAERYSATDESVQSEMAADLTVDAHCA
jgi:hypothetical protein